MTASEDIRQQCLRKGQERALSFGRVGPDTVAYARLGDHIETVASRLHRLGVRPGTLYGVRVGTRLHSVLLLALERLGAGTVSVQSPGEIDSLKLATVFSDQDIPGARCSVVRVSGDWIQSGTDFAAPPLPHVYSPDDICRVAFTSGTTGKPKPIGLTHGMLVERTLNQNLAFGEVFIRATRRLCCVGINTMFGYRILVRTLAEGGLFGFPDMDMPRTVKRIAAYGFQSILGSPMQLAHFADYGELYPNSFTSVEVLICIGARLPPSLADKLRRYVCPRLLLSYASAELGVAAAGSAEKLDLAHGEVGYLIPRVQVEILDEESGLPVLNRMGRVRISSEGGPHGYFGEDQSANFDGRWFYPGDLGTLSPDGRLSIAGRLDNVINFSGVKTTFEAVEADLLEAPAVKDVAVVATQDGMGVRGLIAFVVPMDRWSEPAFRDHCIKRRSPVNKVVLLQDIPRGPSGKIDRQRLQSLA